MNPQGGLGQLHATQHIPYKRRDPDGESRSGPKSSECFTALRDRSKSGSALPTGWQRSCRRSRCSWMSILSTTLVRRLQSPIAAEGRACAGRGGSRARTCEQYSAGRRAERPVSYGWSYLKVREPTNFVVVRKWEQVSRSFFRCSHSVQGCGANGAAILVR
jgi:hypothetical protein